MKTKFPEIKQNIIKFLSPRYKNVMYVDMGVIIKGMRTIFPFDMSYDEEDKVLTMHLGDDVNIPLQLDIEEKETYKIIKDFE